MRAQFFDGFDFDKFKLSIVAVEQVKDFLILKTSAFIPLCTTKHASEAIRAFSALMTKKC